MSDNPSDDQELASAEGEKAGDETAATPQPVRRPRPAPSSGYVPGRRSRSDQPSTMSMIVVPIIALCALLALLGALLFDHFHKGNSAATPAVTVPTQAPAPTAVPTATLVVLPTPVTTKPGVAAVVNGEPVPIGIYNAEVQANSRQIQTVHQDPNTGASIAAVNVLTPAGKKAVHDSDAATLKGLTETYMVVGYAKQHHLLATKAQVTSAVASYESAAGGATAFESNIKSQGFTMSQVNEIVGTQATFNNVAAALGKHAPCPCDRHARQILLKTKDTAQADRLAKELQANGGKNFAALAKQYSTDTATKLKGGDLGFQPKGTLEAALETAEYKLKIGQISNPVKTTSGLHIIQVLGQQPSSASQQTYVGNWVTAQFKAATIKNYVQLPKT